MSHAQELEDALFARCHTKQVGAGGVRGAWGARPGRRADGGRVLAPSSRGAAAAGLPARRAAPAAAADCRQATARSPGITPRPSLPPCPHPQVYLSAVANAVRLARSAHSVADIPRIAAGEPREVAEGRTAGEPTPYVTGLAPLKPDY